MAREAVAKTYPIGAQLELHVHVGLVLKAVLEADNVWMLHSLMNLDLTKKLATYSSSVTLSLNDSDASRTLLLFLVDLSCSFAITLRAFRVVPSGSVLTYTRAKPPCIAKAQELSDGRSAVVSSRHSHLA